MNLEFENLLVTIDGPVATITLNRPEKLNALSEGLMNDYHSALKALDPGDSVRVIRLKGAGRAFCPGYDLSGSSGGYRDDSGTAATKSKDPDDIPLSGHGQAFTILEREGMRQVTERWLQIWNYRKPVIAQVHGYCLSGGLDLLATTDVSFAASGTRFGHPASRGVGIPLMLGMLPLKIGASKTKRILFTGDLIEAEEGKEWGLVDHVVDEDLLDAAVMHYCQRVAMLPMDALSIHKHVVNRWSEIQGARTGAFESVDFDALYHTTPAYHEFGRRIMTDGLNAALVWRDAPFKEQLKTKP